MKETTDIWFASFLLNKGHKIADFELVGKHRGKYKFNITDEEWKQFKLEYISSDIKKLEELHKQLKDLLY